jgi:DNA processing protein
MISSASPPATAHARGAVTSREWQLVDVEASIGSGPADLDIRGLRAGAARETRDRIRAAIINSGLPWPSQAITVTLTPAVSGASLDLAIAVAILSAVGALPEPGSQHLFLAELGLDGALRPVAQAQSALMAAAAAGCVAAITDPVTSAGNDSIPAISAIGLQSLRAVGTWLQGCIISDHDPSASLDPPDQGGSVTGDRVSRAILTHLAGTGSPLMGSLLAALSPAEALTAVRDAAVPAVLAGQLPGLQSAVARWHEQLAGIPDDGGLARADAVGITLVCPGEPGWPTQLDQLGPARPCALWVRGNPGLWHCSARSAAVIGARAATPYGAHIAGEIGGELARRGWTVVSGAAYGIDASAHTAALAERGSTIAVLPGGPDVACPPRHARLLEQIASHGGAVISEWPAETRPDRQKFLSRNRIIAALAAGTVVVEAAAHSGTMNAARHTVSLRLPLMAVPGPVTSVMSAGCHELIRDQHATCVSTAAEVVACLAASPPWRRL